MRGEEGFRIRIQSQQSWQLATSEQAHCPAIAEHLESINHTVKPIRSCFTLKFIEIYQSLRKRQMVSLRMVGEYTPRNFIPLNLTKSGSVFTSHSQEHSLSAGFANLNVTQLLIG